VPALPAKHQSNLLVYSYRDFFPPAANRIMGRHRGKLITDNRKLLQKGANFG